MPALLKRVAYKDMHINSFCLYAELITIYLAL